MANDDTIAALGGLRPVTQPFGTVKRSYYRLTTSTVAVFIGQPMDLDTNGQVIPCAAATTAGTAAAAGNCCIGSVIGFARDSRGKMGLPDNMSLITAAGYLPGNTDAYVCIADDPNQEFVIQEVSTTSQLTTANIGNLVSFTYGRTSNTSGSTLTGASYAELDPATAATGTSAILQLVGLADNFNSDGTNNALGAYAKWKVRIAKHRLGNQTGTFGSAV